MLRDISISKKLYFIVGTMAVLIVIELVTLTFAIHTLSSVRAFVGKKDSGLSRRKMPHII